MSANLLHVLHVLLVESLLSLLKGLLNNEGLLELSINLVRLSNVLLKSLINKGSLTWWNILVDLAFIGSFNLLSDLALGLLGGTSRSIGNLISLLLAHLLALSILVKVLDGLKLTALAHDTHSEGHVAQVEYNGGSNAKDSSILVLLITWHILELGDHGAETT